MAEIGAFLSSEEHGPAELVAQAQLGEEAAVHSHLDLRSLPSLDRRAG